MPRRSSPPGRPAPGPGSWRRGSRPLVRQVTGPRGPEEIWKKTWWGFYVSCDCLQPRRGPGRWHLHPGSQVEFKLWRFAVIAVGQRLSGVCWHGLWSWSHCDFYSKMVFCNKSYSMRYWSIIGLNIIGFWGKFGIYNSWNATISINELGHKL